jgi:hypothetical protein
MSDGPPPRFRLSLLGTIALSGPNGLVDLSIKKLVGLLAHLALAVGAKYAYDRFAAAFVLVRLRPQ